MLNYKKALHAIGATATPVLAKRAKSALLADGGWSFPAALSEFYDVADGGEVSRLNCRFLPLRTALERAADFAHIESFRGLPIFESLDAVSDPCVIMVGGPFSGAIYLHHHALDRRILAPSLLAFMKCLAKLPPQSIDLAEQKFIYPKKMTKPEQVAVRRMLETPQANLKDDYEPELLVELALSMLRDEDVLTYVSGWEHPNHNARQRIERRIQGMDGAASRAVLREMANNRADFVNQALHVLKKAGFTATSTDGQSLYVKEGDSHLNVEMFYDRRNEPDCWDYLLERVRRFASMQ